MRLTAKLFGALLIGLSIVLALFARQQMQGATERFQSDMEEDARALGRLFRPTVARAWRMEGREAAMYIIQFTNETLKSANVETKMRLRWVWLDSTEEGYQPRVPLEDLAGTQSLILPADDRMYTYVPVDVEIEGEPRGALEISESTAPLHQYGVRVRREVGKTMLLVAGVCAGLILLIGTWFVARPLQKLAEAADRIGAGDLSVRVDLRQRDEVGKLAERLNESAQKLQTARVVIAAETEARLNTVQQLRHVDRLSSVGAFASGIAHELGTPLAVVAGRANLIADGTATGESIPEYARSIAKQADKMAAIIRQLLDFARKRSVTLTVEDLGLLAEQTLKLLRPLANKQRVELEFERPPEAVQVALDSVQLQQVLTNLVMNGIEAMSHAGGKITVEIGHEHATPPADHGGSEGRYVFCRVTDEGTGISPEHCSKVFEPFFTTKPVGRGTGLGLAVSHGIAAEHGGWIEVDSVLGEGTAFSVYLPADGPKGA